jgi:peptidoglycan/LPS O-acetylase OafA/YrhL
MQTATSSPKAQRIPALDFTKGALVLIMVLYHWINYFIGPQWPYYRYLRFLTPSFIFISGFMVSHIYLAKYDSSDSRLPKRLITRGVKLLAIFFALNLARTIVVPLLSTGHIVANQLSVNNSFSVFVTGDFSAVSGKLVAFYILVPIAYLLIISGILMVPFRLFKRTFHAACVLLLLLILTLDLTGAESPNLELVTIGMLGVLLGFRPIASINNFTRHPYALAFAYVGYLTAISLWNVPYALLIVGVSLSVMIIYLTGTVEGKLSRIRSEVILLGKYSLFGYISQIAILQLLYVGLRHFNLDISFMLVSFVAAFALTVISVEVVDRARVRAASMDKLYKAVFA